MTEFLLLVFPWDHYHMVYIYENENSLDGGMVDTLDSKSNERNFVWVQIPFQAPIKCPNKENNIQKIAIIGSDGQIGNPLTKQLLKLKHEVLLIVRNKNKLSTNIIKNHLMNNAKVVVCENMKNENFLASILKGYDTLICAVTGSQSTILEYEPIWLKAALKAKINRFVPSEFGAHTIAMPDNIGVEFDYKKKIHELIFKSKIN